jgi:hypothetical protein
LTNAPKTAMVSLMNFYAGIDPGATGGLAVIDRAGRYVAAHRWQTKDPAKLFTLLQALKGQIIGYLYLELVQTFPQLTSGFQNLNQGLLVNLGIWQGFLLAAGIDYELISPLTWQSVHGLQSWAKRQKTARPGDVIPHSPLSLARSRWPAAPLEFQADDGKAVALLLADMARLDDARFVNRRHMREAREEKEKAKKKRIRDNKKAIAAAQDAPPGAPCPWPPAAAPGTRPQGQVQPGSPRQQAQVRPKFVFYPE